MSKYTKATRATAYEIITAKIIEGLEGGQVPWRKTWSGTGGTAHHNAFSKHQYRGINPFVLSLQGYTDPRWATFNQIKKAGGAVRKGERGTPVTFWKFFEAKREDEDGNVTKKSIPMLRYYTVFNVTQADGLPEKFQAPPEPVSAPTEHNPVAEAEAIIEGMPSRPSIAHDGGDAAYYSPVLDEIHLPAKEAFEGSHEYYSTAFHELGHSTGHKSRLDRHGLETGIGRFGSANYSREELAAEFAAAFLCGASGITNTVENSTAYIQGWLSRLRSDPKLAIIAAGQGQRAADYIQGL